MSSAAILSQMQHCEVQIQRKQAEIAELVKKLEDQEECRSGYNAGVTDYEAAVGGYERKILSIESVAAEMRYAQKAGYVFGEHKAKRDSVLLGLESVATAIRREMEANRELLYDTQREEANLRQQLEYLGSDYQNALRREAEEAARAAAEAAAPINRGGWR